jgi:tyrosyl-tRNA synthetase
MNVEKEVQRQVDVVASRAAEIVPADELTGMLRTAIEEERPLRVKYGIDPTNPHVHIGHLVPCRVLRALQDLGHTAVLIVGDYTARIGDPTGRNTERPPLSEEEIRANTDRYAEQLFTVIDESSAELHYQSSWFSSVGLDDVLRLLASFSVAQMMAHETFRSRVDSGNRLSLHELLYPVLQAYDSLMIEADVEIGGTDQRFNCLCGRDLQRAAGKRPQVVVTVPLLMGSDGRKMSKSMDNHIPLATDWSLEERHAAVEALRSGSRHPRDAKLAVAEAIAAGLHGTAEAHRAVAEFERVFSRREVPAEMEELELPAGRMGIVDLLVEAGLAGSKSEARRLVAQGGVRVDGEPVGDHAVTIGLEAGSPRVLRVGKRRFLRVVPRNLTAT